MAVHDNKSYKSERRDLLSQLDAPLKLLDVGCNNGALARAIKRKFPVARIWGLEINELAFRSARPDLEGGAVIDLDDLPTLRTALAGLRFDHIICGDVLEHTVNYRDITGILYEHLEPRGRIIISVPNYGHWHTLWVFLTRKWQRNERGIFDKTHRTVIMRGNLKEFMEQCPNAEFKLLKRNFRFFETNKAWKLNMLVTYSLFPLLIIPYLKDLVTLGYVFSITKPE